MERHGSPVASRGHGGRRAGTASQRSRITFEAPPPHALPLLDDSIPAPPPDAAEDHADWASLAAEWGRLAAEWDERAAAWTTMAGRWTSSRQPKARQAGERAYWAAQRAHDLATWIRQAARDLCELA